MSQEKEYFAGRTADESDAGLTILPLPFWAALFAAFLVVISGCASTARDAEVCYIKPMGNTEEGLIVVLQQCITPEAFEEAQKCAKLATG
jgi:hypothetical protein